MFFEQLWVFQKQVFFSVLSIFSSASVLLVETSTFTFVSGSGAMQK